MIQLNLLPDLKKEYIKSQKNKALVITVSVMVSVVAMGLSALLFIYVTFMQPFQINLVTQDISKKSAELKAVPNIDKYLTIQNQLSSLPDLHNSKGLYSRLFDFLSVINPAAPNNVTLSSLEVNSESKVVVFNGATTSYESLNVFVDTLKNAVVEYKPAGQAEATKDNMFSQVLVQSSGFDKNTTKNQVTFSVQVNYNENLFAATNSGVKVSVPSITTSPSVTGAPSPSQQLFNSTGGQ